MRPTSESLTTTVLVESLRDPRNASAWMEFDRRFRPIAEAVARRMGLGEDAAIEAAQESIARFAAAARAGRYEPGKGRLRSFLAGIVRNVVRERWRDAARSPIRRGGSALGDRIDEDDAAAVAATWDREQRRVIAEAAIDELRRTSQADPRTMRAFELVALRDVPAASVAEACGMQVAEVHRVKHRLTARLRTIVERLSADYEDGP